MEVLGDETPEEEDDFGSLVRRFESPKKHLIEPVFE